MQPHRITLSEILVVASRSVEHGRQPLVGNLDYSVPPPPISIVWTTFFSLSSRRLPCTRGLPYFIIFFCPGQSNGNLHPLAMVGGGWRGGPTTHHSDLTGASPTLLLGFPDHPSSNLFINTISARSRIRCFGL